MICYIGYLMLHRHHAHESVPAAFSKYKVDVLDRAECLNDYQCHLEAYGGCPKCLHLGSGLPPPFCGASARKEISKVVVVGAVTCGCCRGLTCIANNTKNTRGQNAKLIRGYSHGVQVRSRWAHHAKHIIGRM